MNFDRRVAPFPRSDPAERERERRQSQGAAGPVEAGVSPARSAVFGHFLVRSFKVSMSRRRRRNLKSIRGYLGFPSVRMILRIPFSTTLCVNCESDTWVLHVLHTGRL